MSDCQERDFVWESLISPGKRKRKKNSRKDKACVKHKNNITKKTDEGIQKKKKKKKSKFTEAMQGRKEKKKVKKNKSSVELDHNFVFTRGYSGASGPFAKSKPESSHPCSTEKIKPDDQTQDSKRTKRKKKVAWDLSPGYIHVKRPKFVSSSPKENIFSEEEAVRDVESCSQVTVTSQPHDNDSQCTADDINSQDLFITQKKFRVSPSESSSGEASDKAFITSPTPVTQRDRRLHSSGVQVEQHEGSNIHLQQSHFYQHPKKAKEHLQRPKTVQVVLIEEEEEEEEEEKGLHLAQQIPKKKTLSFQKQKDLNTNLIEEKKASSLVHVKPSVVNPYLDEPVVVNPSLYVTKSDKYYFSSSQQSPSHLQNSGGLSLLPLITKASISTQTENFFTTELSSYLNFCQKRVVTICSESLKPLDLSLPRRARKDLPSVNVNAVNEEKRNDQKPSSLPEKTKGNGHKDPSMRPSRSSEMKDVEVKKEPSGRQQGSVSAQGKGKTPTPSPQSESEAKSANSSEDSELPCCTGKPDLTQVRAVQTRLNESFFFKTKGEGQSLRPESPLMKLAQGREMKSRKSH